MTTKFTVMVTLTVTDLHDRILPPEDLEQALDEVQDELIKLDVEDPDIGAALAKGNAEISVTVQAPGPEEAVHLADARIRAAIHASGGFTPDWDQQAPPKDADWTGRLAKLELQPA